MYDKRKEFEEIEKKLDEIRRLCNRERIPFVWAAAVKDDGEGTTYSIAVDDNESDAKLKKLHECVRSNAITPGYFNTELTNDIIKKIILVLNGFDTCLPGQKTEIFPEAFSYNSLMDERGGFGFDADESECSDSGWIKAGMDDEGSASLSDWNEEEGEFTGPFMGRAAEGIVKLGKGTVMPYHRADYPENQKTDEEKERRRKEKAKE